ncbi:MAG: class I tRNA ligase family protein [Candidatus Saccharimonadales bacterium]
MRRYNPKEIEPKWQAIWDETGVYTTDLGSDKPKYFAMSMFNYPSGAGIHIGHAMNYTISDVKARFKRQQGYESYHPVGWDAFGLPAENYAIKSGVSPQESMAKIIPDYHKQYRAMGWSNDWEKELSTHLPEYYKWSQWIFGQMYKNGLAYQDSRMQWWCSIDNTVLANEQVIDGKCWRHDGVGDPPAEKREVKQWFFKITDYADELLEAIDDLDWTESVKLAQKNWIGKSVGAEIDFKLDKSKELITVFTTRPDTIFGATFLVLAPEHELVRQITTKEFKSKIDAYVRTAMAKSEVERQENKDKTGVFTGAYTLNPATGEKIPVWIADYVLTGYGTGAIMAVPAHDERDNEFARKFKLPIKQVVAQDFGEPLSDTKDADGANIIGYDPTTKRFMSLKNHNTNMTWLASGNRDGGELYEETARRELHEESGYQNVKQLIDLGGDFYSYYYNDVKKVNKRARGRNFLAIISEAELIDQHNEDHESYTPQWTDLAYIVAEITKIGGGVEHWLDALEKAGNAAKSYDKGIEYVTPTYHGEGMLVNSGEYSGLSTSQAREKIVVDLAEKGLAKEKVNFRVRDWSVSRQRYWGAPIPIINCPKCGPVLVPDEDLPVILPELTDFQPAGDGRSALARATDWLKVDCPKCGGQVERETDTLDTYVDSSFYMYRYLDPHNQEQIFDSQIVKKWEPVDFYNGGDHATAHLLYARFIGHFLKNLGLINQPEPFKQFLFNGKVTAKDGTMFSKSKGNGVDPLEIINQGYGADALRTYLMFAAPLDLWMRWDPQGVPGTHRFLSRLWNLVQELLATKPGEPAEPTKGEILRATHRTIKKVTEDLEENRYNTAIAAMMECVNDLYKLKTSDFGQGDTWQQALESLVACVAPFAPHIADELWQQLGHSSSVQKDSWPKWDEKYLATKELTLAVQINGKVRAEIVVSADIDQDEIQKAALSNQRIKELLSGAEPKRVIFVPGRLVNIVV